MVRDAEEQPPGDDASVPLVVLREEENYVKTPESGSAYWPSFAQLVRWKMALGGTS